MFNKDTPTYQAIKKPAKETYTQRQWLSLLRHLQYVVLLELQTSFTIMEEAPSRAFSRLKAPTSDFTLC